MLHWSANAFLPTQRTDWLGARVTLPLLFIYYHDKRAMHTHMSLQEVQVKARLNGCFVRELIVQRDK